MCGTFEYGLNAAAKEFDGKNKYIRITDIDDASREFLLSDLSSPDICLDGMSKYLLSSGDIVFARTGASVGKTYIYRENDGIVYFAGFLIRAKVNQDNDAEFVFQSTLSPSYEKYIRITSQRSGQPGVNAQEYGEYDLFAPSKEEQQRIGHFLRGIDNLITLHQRKFEKLTNVKKSMLEKMFPQNGSSYPEIRFKGFTDPWEQRKLSEITDKVTEKNAGLQYVETFTNSAEFGIISQRDFFDHDIAKLGSLDGYYIVKTEDFVYNPRISTSAPVGPINRNKLGRTGVMSPLYTVFRPHDIDTTYLEYFFKCGYWHSFMNFNGDSGARSDRFSIRDNVFFQMPIPIPDIDEQRKIGELLTCLDNLITLHQRKFEKLTNVKKSMLEKMFPQNGCSYPEIRFKGFTDAWEQRKVSELAEKTYGGGTPSTLNEAYWDGDIPWIQSSDVVDGRLFGVVPRKRITQYGLNNSATQLVPKNSIAIITRVGVGKLAFMPYSYATSQDFLSLSKLNAEPLFTVYACYKKLQSELNAVQGTSIKGITKDELLAKTVMVPQYAEQQQIGAFFSQLDNLITLHQRELEKLQNIKKSMLEKMFVYGGTRKWES